MSKSHIESDCSHELRTLLGDWLRVWHLAQPLVSLDAEHDVSRETECWRRRGFSMLGVMDKGRIVGSIRVDALQEHDWRTQIQPIADEQVIDGDAPLLALISLLADRPWLFVRQDGKVNGFVSRSDFQRAPFRMLLFGLISLFEMRLLYLVEQQYSEADIAAALNASRLDKAQALHAERTTRGEELHLADCLQIADKRDLLLAVHHGSALLGFDSNKKAYRFFGRVEALRDRLVHANDLSSGSSWEEVLAVTMELADFLARQGDGSYERTDPGYEHYRGRSTDDEDEASTSR